MRNGTGDYTVTFTGAYPAGIGVESLVVQATAEGNLQEASAVVQAASSTSISVEVFTFGLPEVMGGIADVDDSFWVSLQVGE